MEWSIVAEVLEDQVVSMASIKYFELHGTVHRMQGSRYRLNGVRVLYLGRWRTSISLSRLPHSWEPGPGTGLALVSIVLPCPSHWPDKGRVSMRHLLSSRHR
jgi:hypothetical protein